VRTLAATTAAGAVFLCAGCGGAPKPAASDRAWRANAAELVSQLRADVAATELAGTSTRSAARSLANVSDLYTLLVAYSDLAGCAAMASATSAPPAVVRVLSRPCGRLQRAAALFTRAETSKRPALLAQATREVERAVPQLVRVALLVRRD
jgi:hypothetical protein